MKLIAKYVPQHVALNIAGVLVHLAIPADVDEVLERGEDPYWAELWPSALGLAEYLVCEFSCPERVLMEIGCGLGLVGLVARKQGAQVLLTDYNQEALEFTRYNLARNGCVHTPVRFLDWHAPKLQGRFDGILASDVIYAPANWEALLNLWKAALKPEGEVLLAEPGRPKAREFFDLAASQGFTWQQTFRDVRYEEFRSVDHEEREYRIDIYRLRVL